MLEKGNGQYFMKSILLLLSTFVSILFLSGCWDRVEVNDLAIVTGAAIDKKDDNQLELTLQIFIPKTLGGGGGEASGSGGGQMTFTASQTGKNIADSLSKIQGKIPREIFWGQCKVFIFGEDLAKQGIQEQMDFLLRHPEPRGRAYVYISEGNAKNILEIVPNIERYSTEVLREISNYRVGMQITIQDIDEMLTGTAQAAAVPYVKIKKEQPSEGKPLKYVHIDGTAVFQKDQMVGRITEAETRGVLWLRDEIKGYTVSVEIEGEEGLVSLNPVSARVDLIPQIHDGKWKMTVKVATEGAIVQNETNLSFSDPKVLKKVESAYQKSIENRIQEALKQVQHELHADIVDFSKEFYREYPKQWKRVENHWDELFPEVEVNINVKAHIRRRGHINKPGSLPDEEVKEE
ncbi:Ger(x)C family spore germination protein [Bacillus sp. V3B]|uniref:Ger(x)C family spore germination protein n=1 Tax=Bacillus sp. V3B TaxID=2804915 RepID=UPI00210A7197|nr:Ger(x)C family spore germination protein [Bacillus sp. V3B]MCQ6277508.1 Ger(x)C family spore germination protein [Bacillus sp. V3B]